MFLQDSHLFLQFLFSPQVITVKECDPLAFRLADSIISCSCSTCVLYISENPYSFVSLCQLLHTVICIVTGTVVNDQHFPVLHCLSQHTLHSFFQIFFAIVSRGDDRYSRHKIPFLIFSLLLSALLPLLLCSQA